MQLKIINISENIHKNQITPELNRIAGKPIKNLTGSREPKDCPRKKNLEKNLGNQKTQRLVGMRKTYKPPHRKQKTLRLS